ncbi:hypothetical protein CASFOL_004708 [Castilleja foliolosa]|uniref:Uncharacterized protein n=1 Tax=Castilleja foliolosa TaxID=1961234 RepID=A0ABD3EC23_9LAMI
MATIHLQIRSSNAAPLQIAAASPSSATTMALRPSNRRRHLRRRYYRKSRSSIPAAQFLMEL